MLYGWLLTILGFLLIVFFLGDLFDIFIAIVISAVFLLLTKQIFRNNFNKFYAPYLYGGLELGIFNNFYGSLGYPLTGLVIKLRKDGRKYSSARVGHRYDFEKKYGLTNLKKGNPINCFFYPEGRYKIMPDIEAFNRKFCLSKSIMNAERPQLEDLIKQSIRDRNKDE